MIAFPELIYAFFSTVVFIYISINFIFKRSPSTEEPDPHLLYNSDSSESEEEEEEVKVEEFKDVKEPEESTVSTEIVETVELREPTQERPIPPPRRRSYQTALASPEPCISPDQATSPQSPTSLNTELSPVEMHIRPNEAPKVRSHSEEIIPVNHIDLLEDSKRSSWQCSKSKSVSEAFNEELKSVGNGLQKIKPPFDLIDLCDNPPRPTITCTGADKIELLPEENQK